MKKGTILLLQVLIIVAAFHTSVWAVPLSIEVGDQIVFNDGIGDPGVIVGVGRGGAYDASSPDSSWDNFMTFCLEVDEHLSFGYAYHVGGITTVAQKGGVNTDDGDYLDSFTAWLYTQAVDGTYAYQDMANVQYSIWYSEDEISEAYLTSAGAKGFYDAQYGAYEQAVDNAEWSGLGNVRVLNIVKKYGDGSFGPRQDVLATVAVPESAPFLLLGVSLLGVAGLGRKRFIKK